VGQAAVARQRDGAAFVQEIAGGVAVFTGPQSPANKMIGVGFTGVPADDALCAVEQRFQERQAPLRAEVSTLAEPEFAAALTRRGYVLQGFENALGRRLDAADAEPLDRLATLDLRIIEPADFGAWVDVFVLGFLNPDLQGLPGEPLPSADVLKGILHEFADVPGLRRYALWVEGRMVASAAMRLDEEGLAQLCGAATLPEFRRRGIQSAFFHRRLADAVTAGCDLAVLTTQPGSKSQQNAHSRGFGLLYSRAVLVKSPP
jgi:hypothetical protein